VPLHYLFHKIESCRRIIRIKMRSPGRQKNRRRIMIQKDTKFLRLKNEDTDGRMKWRIRIRVADPSPWMY